jgi:putative endonuclease
MIDVVGRAERRGVTPAQAGAQVMEPSRTKVVSEYRGYVYILASKPYGTLYIGVTNDLVRRTWEHRTHCVPGFTKQHDVTHLVWFECHSSIEAAITREKQIKEWRRGWKVNLIQEMNPEWRDLYDEISQ